MLEESLELEQQGVLSEEDRREELKEHPEVAEILAAFEGLRADTIGAQGESASSYYQLLSDRLAAFREAESAEVAITAAAIEEFRGRVSGLVLAVLTLPLCLAIYFLWQLTRQHDSLAQEVSRQTEALRATASELAEVDGQRRLFFAKIGHELRTPLTVLLAEADLGREDGAGGTVAGARFERIAIQASLMARRVRDLLALARSEAGQLQLERAPVELSEVITTVERLAKAHGEQRQVFVDCRSLGCAGVELLADAEWLTQAIMALVDNAIKASSAEHAVAIDFAAERVGWVTVSVIDRGPGVRGELIPDLGRPFFQQLDSAAGSGIGLGLSVAQWVAEQHGGALSLNNRDGGGLVAQIELPVLS